jgi:hypothetical protein
VALYFGAVADVVILVPVLTRPQNVGPLVDSVAETCDARLLFIASPERHTEFEAIEAAGAEYLVTPFGPKHGDYARKINWGITQTDEAFIFMGADDLRFHEGWLERALLFAGDFAVVGTNDLGNAMVMAGDHSTHSLVDRGYVEEMGTADEPGKALHEGYWHEFVDDEFVRTAMSRGEFVSCRDSIVEHMHPHWGKAPSDAIYDVSARRLRRGRRLYRERAHLWGEDPPAR